jgi:hypothetical protein
VPAVPVLHAAKTGHDLTQVGRRPELEALLRHVPHQILCQDFGKAGHVEDVFLRVQRHELPAQRRKRIDDAGRCAAHAGIEGCEETGRAPADNRDILEFLLGQRDS